MKISDSLITGLVKGKMNQNSENFVWTKLVPRFADNKNCVIDKRALLKRLILARLCPSRPCTTTTTTMNRTGSPATIRLLVVVVVVVVAVVVVVVVPVLRPHGRARPPQAHGLANISGFRYALTNSLSFTLTYFLFFLVPRQVSGPACH